MKTQTSTLIDRDEYRPIPMPIAIGLAFIPEGLPEDRYIKRVKKLVRKCVNPPRKDLYDSSFFAMYDARIWKIIREVMAEN